VNLASLLLFSTTIAAATSSNRGKKLPWSKLDATYIKFSLYSSIHGLCDAESSRVLLSFLGIEEDEKCRTAQKGIKTKTTKQNTSA
jgi:hypothetical protein